MRSHQDLVVCVHEDAATSGSDEGGGSSVEAFVLEPEPLELDHADTLSAA
jgi:hypothetical protein